MSTTADRSRLAGAVLLLVPAVSCACSESEGSGPSPSAQASPARGQALDAYQAGRALFQQDRPLEALAELRRAVRLDPELHEARLALGKILLHLSSVWFGTPTRDRARIEEAVQVLQQAEEQDPDSVEAAYWAGYALLLAERTEEAEQSLRRALELDPAYGPAYKQLGLLHAAEGEGEPARRELLRAIELLPRDDEVLFQYGLQLEADDELQGAREAYEKAVAIHPARPGPYSRLAVVNERLGDAEGASRASAEFTRWSEFGRRLNEALRRAQAGDPAAPAELERLYQEAGMEDQARSWRERAQGARPPATPAGDEPAADLGQERP